MIFIASFVIIYLVIVYSYSNRGDGIAAIEFSYIAI